MKQLLNFCIAMLLFLSTSCNNKKHEGHEQDSGSVYTCPMHPTVESSSPGSCPVCNMSLIKREKKESGHTDGNGNFVTLTAEKQKLAGIKIDTVRFQQLVSENTLLGTVTIDEQQVSAVSSRVSGRIDRLAVKTTGSYVKKGQPLYSIYSEQLQADEKDYLTLLQKQLLSRSGTDDFKADLVEAAKNKLLLWGLSEEQISELETTRNTNALVPFFSPESGYVNEVNVTEGSYVAEGSPLMKITSLNDVWIEVQVYPNELRTINSKGTFRVFSESAPEQSYIGKLVYNNPVIEKDKRIYLLKIRVKNTDGRLVPGMLVRVASGSVGRRVLVVPRTAVLLEKMKTIWVLAHDNTYEQRMVETGEEDDYWIEITKGVDNGQVVVSDGAYLLSSEFVLTSGAANRHNH